MSDEAQQAARSKQRSQQLAAEIYAEPLLENGLLAASAAGRSLSRAEGKSLMRWQPCIST